MTDKTQSGSERGCLLHRLCIRPSTLVQTETQPQSFQTKTGSAVFSIISVLGVVKHRSSVYARRKRGKSYAV